MSYEQKLFLLLILLVVLPCIVLAVFSMQALFGQKALIEQQIKEGYKALAHSTHKRILDRVKHKERIVKEILRNSPWIGKDPSISNLLIPLKQDHVYKSIYVINSKYQVIYPSERRSTVINDTFMPIENYNLFEKGYRHEFRRNDYLAAINEYKKIVNQDEEKIESVGLALMAIGRCYWKSEKYEEALETYRHFITIFSHQDNLQSINFLIYAKRQISDIYARQKKTRFYYLTLLQLLDFIVENENRLTKTQYLYHYNETLRYLDQLEKDNHLLEEDRIRFLQQRASIFHKQEQRKKNSEAWHTADRYILPLLRQATEYGKKKSGYLDYKTESKHYLVHYHAIYDSEGYFKGYVVYDIDLQVYLREVIVPILQSQSDEKGIFLSVVDDDNFSVTGEIPLRFSLVASQPLSPVFGFWSISVYLKDSKTLDELSHYRSRIYLVGIILVLLILLSGVYITIATFVREVKSARLKSDFVSNVSHELKTPLTAIKMFVETLLLGRAMSQNDQQECLQVISAEADRLQRLIDRILDFAKMEQNKRTFHFETVNPGELIHETINHFRKQIPDSERVDIDLSIEPDLPKILVDDEAIGEALINLLSNAYKYCDKEHKKIEISSYESDNTTLAISIKDNGIGIPKHEFQRIFQKFYRIENSQASRIEGTGLGLALIESIVKAHKGKIELQSRLQVGSTFTILLPYVQANHLKEDDEESSS